MDEKVEESIKRENKKALPKYILFLLGCMFLGFIMGILSNLAEENGAGNRLILTLRSLLSAAPAFLMPGICALILIPSVIVMKKVKAMWSSWDGEDDCLPDAVEEKLNKLLLLQNISAPMAFLTLTLDMVWDHKLLSSGITLLSFFLYLFLLVVLQKQAVDFSKRMNPEKRGSIYDLKFQTKWLESCDEAEKKQMGEAALSTFYSMIVIYPIAWCVLMFLGKIFGFGSMPSAVTIALWGIQMILFQVKEMKLGRHK